MAPAAEKEAVAASSSSKKKGQKDTPEDIEAKINEIIVEGPTGSGPGSSAVKMEVDYSETTAKAIPEARDMVAADPSRLGEALESLASLEKQTRSGGDSHSTGKVLVAMVQLCFEAKEWTLLNENIITLTKKRSQLKQAVAKMVQECYSYVKGKHLPTRDVELKLIETLRTVTAGKIYVEVERARLTRRLARMQEEDGDVSAAAKTMQELAVETFGSMERKEKVDFILEQMRLCLDTKDYIRTQIISKKISTRYFENQEPEVQELKLRYYEYMVRLDQHEGSYLNVCRHYRAVFDTPCVQEDDEKKKAAMRNVAVYVVLAPHDNEQSDLIHRVLGEKALESLPVYKRLLEQFTTMELIDQERLCQLYEKDLRQGSKDDPATGAFDNTAEGQRRWKDLRDRVVEHNIRIMSKYYTRVTLKRMSELLSLPADEAEEFLSAMVVAGTVEAKTDRLEGIVNFNRTRKPNEVLNDWSNNISNLMGLVQEATHLINKEEMVHRHMTGLAEKEKEEA